MMVVVVVVVNADVGIGAVARSAVANTPAAVW